MKGYRHLTAAQRQVILASYQRTLSASATAVEVGVTWAQVHYLLKTQGIVSSNSHNGKCYQHIDEVRQWSKEGLPLSEIARRIGTKHQTVAAFLRLHQIERTPFAQTGKNNPAWKGGRMVDRDGYVLLHRPDHPHANRHGYVREHRLVMERELGRYLLPAEVVHHSGERDENDPRNLKLYATNSAHLAETRKGRAPNISAAGWERIRESTRQVNTRRRNASLPT